MKASSDRLRPVIGRPDNDNTTAGSGIWDDVLDPAIVVLRKLFMRNSSTNRHWVAKHESVAQSFMEITAMTMVGENMTVSVPSNSDAEQVIRDWNRSTNVRGDPIEELCRQIWKENIIHGGALFRHRFDPELDTKVDTQLVDARTITLDLHPTLGYRRWIQTYPLESRHRTKQQFYKSHETIDQVNPTGTQIVIPDEPSSCLYVSFFDEDYPPISTAMNLIQYKLWITWFMRKYSEKHWAPFLIGKVGDTKNAYFALGPKELQRQVDNLAVQLNQVRDFSNIAIPGYMDIEALKTETARSSQIYVEYLKHLNEEIMYALFGSMGQRTSTGNYVASSSVIDEGWLRFVKGIRVKYRTALRKFYTMVLLPTNMIFDVKPDDIHVEFSHMKTETLRDTMEAIKIAVDIGFFNDRNELREVTQKSFPSMPSTPANGEEGYVPKTVDKPQPEAGGPADRGNERAGSVPEQGS